MLHLGLSITCYMPRTPVRGRHDDLRTNISVASQWRGPRSARQFAVSLCSSACLETRIGENALHFSRSF